MFKFSRLSPAADVVSDTPSAASLRLAWLAALVLAFACAASAGYWGLRLLARPAQVPADARDVGRLDAESLAAAAPRLFGHAIAARQQEPVAPARFRLWGVIGGGTQAGSALIGVDGKPPRAIAVGDAVAPGVRLESTAYGEAVLVQDGVRLALKLQPTPGRPSSPATVTAPSYALPQAVDAQESPAPTPTVPSFTPSMAPSPVPRPPR
ncbi:general secretion pathway protein GspC [Thiomonas sp.]|uniref:general secretion pathway protein GspC n=1 Tax=Thiomonas sp. TaxID=2047785 RepID=UPI0025826383|nr:general secretion pathway protein GspC [Thiomonas sp.]